MRMQRNLNKFQKVKKPSKAASPLAESQVEDKATTDGGKEK